MIHIFVSGEIQSILVISKSMGLSEILRYINNSTYQIYRIEEKLRTTILCNLTPEVRKCFKHIVEKRRHFSSFFPVSCYLLLDFHFKTGTRFSFGNKRFFEVGEVEITRLDCNYDGNICIRPQSGLPSKSRISSLWEKEVVKYRVRNMHSRTGARNRHPRITVRKFSIRVLLFQLKFHGSDNIVKVM